MTRIGDALHKAYTRTANSAAAVDAGIEPARAPNTVGGGTAPVPRKENLATAARGKYPRRTMEWPRITGQLLDAVGGGFTRFAQRLCSGSLEQNIASVVFSGSGRGIGRTSVVLTLARTILEQNPEQPILLIDADFQHPGLAEQLDASSPRGLWEVLQSDVPVESVLETGLGGLCLLPLSGPVSPPELETVGPEGLLPILAELRERFPLILVDAGQWDVFRPVLWDCSGLDALIHVERHGSRSPSVLRSERALCRETGIEFLGVIETFAAAVAETNTTTTPFEDSGHATRRPEALAEPVAHSLGGIPAAHFTTIPATTLAARS